MCDLCQQIIGLVDACINSNHSTIPSSLSLHQWTWEVFTTWFVLYPEEDIFFWIHSTAIRSSPSIEKFYFRWCIVAYHLPLAMYCRRFCNCIYLQGDVSWKLWGLGDIIQESFGKQNFSDTPLEMSRLLTKGKLSRIPPQAAHSVHRRYRHLSATIVPATQTSKTCLYSQVFDDK